MKRKHSPLYDYWTPRVEGQIRHTIGRHPQWFDFATQREKETCINSLAKRIVGEIAAGGGLAAMPVPDASQVSAPRERRE